jgi:hypothetical protein
VELPKDWGMSFCGFKAFAGKHHGRGLLVERYQGKFFSMSLYEKKRGESVLAIAVG